jgi:hypothetical protein
MLIFTMWTDSRRCGPARLAGAPANEVLSVGEQMAQGWTTLLNVDNPVCPRWINAITLSYFFFPLFPCPAVESSIFIHPSDSVLNLHVL